MVRWFDSDEISALGYVWVGLVMVRILTLGYGWIGLVAGSWPSLSLESWPQA